MNEWKKRALTHFSSLWVYDSYKCILNLPAPASPLQCLRPSTRGQSTATPEWTKDVSVWPSFHHARIYNYMVLSVSPYTHEVFSNFRSRRQAQVQFTDAWVQDLEMFRVEHKTVVRTKVSLPVTQNCLHKYPLENCGITFCENMTKYIKLQML